LRFDTNYLAAKRIIGADETTGLYQYFIRVIPTIYTNEYGYQTFTNQYTITDRFRPLALPTPGAPNQVQPRPHCHPHPPAERCFPLRIFLSA
jgi:hypothetical protein